jgi:hypothetical protein
VDCALRALAVDWAGPPMWILQEGPYCFGVLLQEMCHGYNVVMLGTRQDWEICSPLVSGRPTRRLWLPRRYKNSYKFVPLEIYLKINTENGPPRDGSEIICTDPDTDPFINKQKK